MTNEILSHSSKTNIAEFSPLSRYLDERGMVDYNAIKSDDWLHEQLEKISNAKPEDMERRDELAFWLNTYNLLTIKGVMDKLKNNPEWKGNLGIFNKIKFFIQTKHQVGHTKISLDYIEKIKIRKKFRDPRIHFALNCGSASCPVLFGRLYEGEKLELFLDAGANNFINDPNQVHYDPEKNILTLSKIFKWYRNDFEYVGGVRAFIMKYWNGDRQQIVRAKIKYKKYDWRVNSQELI